MALCVLGLPAAACTTDAQSPWWHRLPSYVGHTRYLETTGARMVSLNYAADPTWGLYGQRLNTIAPRPLFETAREHDARWLTWIEGFGDCMLYAAALRKEPDGTYRRHAADPGVVRLECQRWYWSPEALARSTELRWVGLHNTVNDDPFAEPNCTGTAVGLTPPTYPTGEAAVGWLQDRPYPLNAKVFDACGSKDVHGRLFLSSMSLLDDDDPARDRLLELGGLYTLTVPEPPPPWLRGQTPGTTVHADLLSVPKDVAAPFWIEYARHSIRGILAQGIDGVWCDNFSPWDNFNAAPVRKAFGDWSVTRFRAFLADRVPVDVRLRDAADAAVFDVRAYMVTRAEALDPGAGTHLDSPVWRDARWLDDPIWNAYKVFKQQVGQEGLRRLYEVIHEEAERAGRPDFAVCGNDMPLFGLGWVRDEWLDMVATELAPGWGLTTGPRGIMLPPDGRMAVVYQAARVHQKGPYCAPWLYLPEEHRDRPGLGRVLLAEAFANGAFLKHAEGREAVGTPETHGWWNRFLYENEALFDCHVPAGSIGVLFSPNTQLAQVLPGAPAPDFGRQDHSFGHWGVATALVDAHVPYRVLPDWCLTSDALAALDVLFLPGVACLDDDEGRTIEAWVRGGGRLICSGTTGRRHSVDGLFQRRDTPVLTTWLGPTHHVRPPRQGGARRRDDDDGFRAGTEAAVDLDRTGDGGETPHARDADSARPPRRRAMGRGEVVWFADSVGMDYYVHHEQRSERLPQLLDAWRLEPQITTNTANDVGVFVARDPTGRRRLVHLVNYALDAKRDAVEPRDDLSVELRLPAGAEDVTVQQATPDETGPAQVIVTDETARIMLPALHHYHAIRLAW